MATGIDEEQRGPSVSVIVPNWNGMGLLEKCLRSLQAQNYPGLEIVVVDNGSTDGSVEFIKRRFPDIRLIEVGFNAGFAAAVNRGIRETKSDYIALLNNDAVADADWIAEMVKAMEGDSRLGSCASKVMLLNSPEIINCAGLAFVFKLSACSRVLGWNQPDCLEYDIPRLVLSASGAAVLYRRSALDKTGLFDEDFFLYYEDFDLGLRLQLAGYDCLYVPTALAYHDEKAVKANHSEEIIEMNKRNSRWVVLKCLPLVLLLPGLFSYLIVGLYRWSRYKVIARSCAKRDDIVGFRGLIDRWKSWMSPIREKRTDVQKRRKIGFLRLLHALLRESRRYNKQKRAEKSDSCPIALIAHSYDLGGAEKCLRKQALNLKLLGRDPLVIVPAPGRLARSLVDKGVRTKIMSYQWWVYPEKSGLEGRFTILRSIAAETWRMRSWFRHERIKLVDSASSVIPQGALAAKLVGAKHVWHVRELYPSESLRPVLGFKATRFLIKRLSDKIVVPSRSVARLFSDSSKVAIIPEGIDDAFFLSGSRRGKTLRCKIGAKKDEYVAMIIGVIRPGKDQLTAVRSLAELKKLGIKVHLVLCGDSQEDYKELLLKEIKSLGVERFVHFLGYQFDLQDLLPEADVLLVTSREESFGLSILEAMACRVPVISTRCGGPEELIEDGVTGHLVDIGDHQAIARLFKKITDDPGLKKAMVEKAFDKVKSYNPERVFQDHLNVYREVCLRLF